MGATSGIVRILGQKAQGVEAVVPVTLEPYSELREWSRIRRVEPQTAVSSLAHEPRLAKHAQMPGHRRAADVEVGRDLTGRKLVVAYELEDAPPDRVSDGCGRFHDV
jgi:hypothetical protein